jgi:hypothetical protein
MSTFQQIVSEVAAERERQNSKWGEQNHSDGTGRPGSVDDANYAKAWCDEAFEGGYGTWGDILREEVCEAFAESDPKKLRTELIQVAAVAIQWIAAIDRREGAPK